MIDDEQSGGSGRSGEAGSAQSGTASCGSKAGGCASPCAMVNDVSKSSLHMFTSSTKAIVWGLQSRAVQGMLDFDYVCSRQSPSVVAMVYPFV